MGRLPTVNIILGNLGALGTLPAPSCTITTPYKPRNTPYRTHPTLISTHWAPSEP